jgi:hypothetical protein
MRVLWTCDPPTYVQVFPHAARLKDRPPQAVRGHPCSGRARGHFRGVESRRTTMLVLPPPLEVRIEARFIGPRVGPLSLQRVDTAAARPGFSRQHPAQFVWFISH